MIFLSVDISIAKNETSKSVTTKQISNYQKIDMNQFKSLNTKANTNIKLYSNCKNRAGFEFKDSDTGYASCLNEVEVDQKSRAEEGASTSAVIKIGN